MKTLPGSILCALLWAVGTGWAAQAAPPTQRVLMTNFAILVGFPADAQSRPGEALLIPGTLVPLTSDASSRADRRILEKSLTFANAVEKLWSTFRLDPGRQLQRVHTGNVAIDGELELPVPVGADLGISAQLLRFDDTTATYRMRLKQGARQLADSTINVKRAGRAVVGGMNGQEAPYIFVFVEPEGLSRDRKSADDLLAKGIQPPVIANKIAPKYPPEARKDKVAGVVVLELLVDETGTVTNIDVLQDPDERLTRAAIDAVRQWTFQPARASSGKAVAVRTALTIKFALQ